MSSKYLENRALEEAIDDYRWSRRNLTKLNMLLEDVNQTIEDLQSFPSTVKSHKIWKKAIQDEISKEEMLRIPKEERLARYFYLMAENIIRKPIFKSIEEDDAIQESVIICMEKIGHFDTRKGKAFSYVTQMIFHRFLHIMRNTGVYIRLKQRYLTHLESMCPDSAVKFNSMIPIADFSRKQ